MTRYKLINNITGWVVFAVAAVTYLLTIEPTASLWDCGEFVATGYKMEVGHPPGCAIFMLLTRLFTIFAGNNVEKVAALANSLSALMSAFTILFLFWTITHLVRKILSKDEADFSVANIITIMGAGAVGALAFAFSDSFWFSAVEGEVYATSSFFTAIVIWAILKWEDCADEEYSSRWIILVAYLMGLSIGVHLLNLLSMPAIFLIYYFKKYNFTWKSFFATIVLSFGILALLVWGIIPGLVTLSTKFDLFFVNTLNLPVNSGMIFHVILLFGFLFYALWLTIKSDKLKKTAVFSLIAIFLSGIWLISGSSVVNIILLLVLSGIVWLFVSKKRETMNLLMSSLLVVLIGYSSTAIIVIRSSAGTPLNENNPSQPFSLLYYLGREQYGSRPLFSGAYYNAPITDYKEGKPNYTYNGDKYVITHYSSDYVYDERFITLFPRMWSRQANHVDVYKQWGGSGGIPVTVTEQSGEKKVVKKPAFRENLRFMFSYQFGYMYMRYFMWNFAGRQNDTQGTGSVTDGNWISGIKFIDEHRVGTVDDMPADMKDIRSRNVYYLLPLLLGLIGLFYQLYKDNKNWWVVMLLFIMTGIAIVFYLNQSPNQPRERDYAYVGSFYFFSVWIGLAVPAIKDLISKITGEKIAAPLVTVLCLFVPVQMGAQNFDDHDRSGRYLARDVACNYLESCAPNAILFSNGDNDTFPLWYAQEVEGKRTDVRVANLMLLNTDWYINQMKQKCYDSDPLPVSLPPDKYYEGVNNQVYIIEKTKDPLDISTVMEWINSSNKATKLQISTTEYLDCIPSRTIRIPVDVKKVLETGTVSLRDSAKIVPYIDIKLKGSSILKSQLMVLDILANNKWERPIYFVSGYHEDALGLEEYFQLEGLAYRLVPVKSENRSWIDYGRIDTDILYNNLMNKFLWRGANNPKVNIDYHHVRTLSVVRARLNYAKLAKTLVKEGKKDKAIEVLDRCMEQLPLSNIPYDPYVPDVIYAYLVAGEKDKAADMINDFCDYYDGHLNYYLKQKPYIALSAGYEIQSSIQNLSKVLDLCGQFGFDDKKKEIKNKLEQYYSTYMGINHEM